VKKAPMLCLGDIYFAVELSPLVFLYDLRQLGLLSSIDLQRRISGEEQGGKSLPSISYLGPQLSLYSLIISDR